METGDDSDMVDVLLTPEERERAEALHSKLLNLERDLGNSKGSSKEHQRLTEEIEPLLKDYSTCNLIRSMTPY